MTEDMLLEALRAAQPKVGDGEGLTTEEIATATGFGTTKVRKLLKAAVLAGRVRLGSKVILTLHGKPMTTHTYVVLKPGKGK
jgi:hypothetical protein